MQPILHCKAISHSINPSINPLTDRKGSPQRLTLTSTQVWLVSASSMLAETWSWMAGPTQHELSITNCSPFSRFLIVFRTSLTPSRVSESYSAFTVAAYQFVCWCHNFVEISALTSDRVLNGFHGQKGN